MLRNGSDGARSGGDAAAVGDGGAAAVAASAEFLSADRTPSSSGRADRVPAGGVLADRAPADASAELFTADPAPDGHATSDPSGSLSLCRLSGGALAGLGREGLLGVLGDIERVANRLAGYRAEVLGALDALSRSGAAPDASPHLSLRDAAGVSERDARRMVRAAGKAREHPGVLDALSEGDVNAAQAEALCDARVPDGVRADLVAAAAGEDTDATRRRVRRAEADHCVETPMERFERQRKARGAGWRRDHEGMLRLWAKFDPDAGAHVEATLAALCREYWIDDKQVRSGRRTPAQRDADVLAYALAGLTYTDADAAAVRRLHARASARSDNLPDEARGLSRQLQPAQVSVLIGLDALRGHTDEMGLTDAGVELPPEVVRRLACDAEIIPMILGGSGGSADAGRCRRTVSLRLRRLLVARDRRCRWPGCHEPPSRCDAHHIWHWLDGGPTNLDNLVLLCRRHHHFLHQHGYRMVPQPDDTWLAVQESDARPTTTPRRAKRQARAP